MESRCSSDWIINHSILHRRIVTNCIDLEFKCTTQVFCLVWACSKVACNNLSYPVQFSSVTKLCPTLCYPMDCSTPDFPVLHYLLEFIQTHVHWVGDAIQPSHLLSPPSAPALNLSQHQDLLQWVGSSHQVVKVMELQLQHQFFQWIVIFSSKLLKNSSASFKILDNLYWPTFCWKWKDQRQIFRSNSLSVFTNWKANLF